MEKLGTKKKKKKKTNKKKKKKKKKIPSVVTLRSTEATEDGGIDGRMSRRREKRRRRGKKKRRNRLDSARLLGRKKCKVADLLGLLIKAANNPKLEKKTTFFLARCRERKSSVASVASVNNINDNSKTDPTKPRRKLRNELQRNCARRDDTLTTPPRISSIVVDHWVTVVDVERAIERERGRCGLPFFANGIGLGFFCSGGFEWNRKRPSDRSIAFFRQKKNSSSSIIDHYVLNTYKRRSIQKSLKWPRSHGLVLR